MTACSASNIVVTVYCYWICAPFADQRTMSPEGAGKPQTFLPAFPSLRKAKNSYPNPLSVSQLQTGSPSPLPCKQFLWFSNSQKAIPAVSSIISISPSILFIFKLSLFLSLKSKVVMSTIKMRNSQKTHLYLCKLCVKYYYNFVFICVCSRMHAQ